MKTNYVKAEIVEKSDDKVVAIASTATVDRHGEIVSVEGWNLKNFKKQPRILWAHDHTIPAIGRAEKIWVEGAGKSAKLMMEIIFQDITALGREAKQLVKQGFIDTFSVGFRANEMDGNKFTDQELLEVSLVNVPANPDAQVVAFKSMKTAGIESEVMQKVGISPQYLELQNKIEAMENEIKAMVNKLEGLNPKDNKPHEVIEHKIALAKIVARATDKILSDRSMSGDNRNLLKVVKRANEQLNSSLKKDL